MSNTVDIACAIQHETDDAILIEVAHEEFWIPFSQVSKLRRGQNGATDQVTVTEWIATQKGIL